MLKVLLVKFNEQLDEKYIPSKGRFEVQTLK